MIARVVGITLALAMGCDGGTSSEDAGRITIDAGRDAGGSSFDAGMEDAGSDAATVPSSDAAVGAPCAFNRECAADQRCVCDETDGCACELGVRGTGELGAPCTVGEDCASSVCVEGPIDDEFFCSEECESVDDCAAPLPRCSEIAFVGRICVREPPL